jgi:hypothetical protein
MKKLPPSFWLASGLIFLLVISSWQRAIHNARVGPHRIVTTAAGREISAYWTTNPVYFTWQCVTNYSTNGVTYGFQRQTNRYW